MGGTYLILRRCPPIRDPGRIRDAFLKAVSTEGAEHDA